MGSIVRTVLIYMISFLIVFVAAQVIFTVYQDQPHSRTDQPNRSQTSKIPECADYIYVKVRQNNTISWQKQPFYNCSL